MILVGDFNCHNEVWNCLDTSAEGLKLQEVTEKHNLFLHNTDTITHVDARSKSKSNIDLAYTSTGISQHVHVTALYDLHGTDPETAKAHRG